MLIDMLKNIDPLEVLVALVALGYGLFVIYLATQGKAFNPG
jgi:hypothetical protein